MIKKTVPYGQSLFDFVVDNYGSLRFLGKFIRDNALNYDGLIFQGEQYLIDRAEGNFNNKSELRRNGITMINNIENKKVVTRKQFEDGVFMLFEDEVRYIFE